MKHYIFYTPEGSTFAPYKNDGSEPQEVDNFQVLGFARGSDHADALAELTRENPWIADCNFSPSEILSREIVQEH